MSQTYVPTVSAAGLLVIGHCISTLVQQPLQLEWLALAALTLLTGSFTIKIPSIPVRLSVSETFVFASVLLFGSCAGTITVALEILVVIAAGTGSRARDPKRIIFNVSSAALSIWLSSHAFYLTAGISPLSQPQSSEIALHTLMLPLSIMAALYFVLNSGMVAAAVALERHTPVLRTWRQSFLGLAVNYFGGASLAALFVSYTRTIDLFALAVIVPLLVISYLTFKFSFSRVEDATRHVAEMKQLYLSTIETLATAIDAKDQITHGHIRRVQQLALALASELGVRDEDNLQALEAAALLHDIGKLVVSEHILNKPGKLTAGEFEKMKQHARVGADILSSINFPYPVVPIVRHHHENWNGTGYPDGLRGTEIPLGARILAVVDCFDALTSDRPYRTRMSDADAISTLLSRRGTMYDPLIVDTFISKWKSLCTSIWKPHQIAPVPTRLTAPITQAPSVRLDGDNPTSLGMSRLLEQALRRTGAELAIMFATDLDRDLLMAVALRTSEGDLSKAVTIPLGCGVAGWVAVNGTAISNAEALLDFRDGTPSDHLLVRTLCVPVTLNGQVKGVISVYSGDPRGFSEDDRQFLEGLAREFSQNVTVDLFDTLFAVKPTPAVGAPRIH